MKLYTNVIYTSTEIKVNQCMHMTKNGNTNFGLPPEANVNIKCGLIPKLA